MADNISKNVSSLVDPKIISSLNSAQNPKAFGDQLKDQTKSKIKKSINESNILRLQKEKGEIILSEQKLEIEHALNLQRLKQKNTSSQIIENGQTVEIPPELDDENYQKAVEAENRNYEESKKIIQQAKKENQKSLDDYLKDPFKEQKDKAKLRTDKIKKLRKKTKEEKRKARKAKTRAILKNAAKSLAPVILSLISDKLADLIAQNDRIQKLVDDTNALIIEANASGNPNKLDNAKLARDNAIRIINDREVKITKISSLINKISSYISIFNLIVSIISAIPIPTSVPPGVGIPTSLIIKLVKILDKANRVLLTLSAAIPILLSILQSAIDILRDLKSQLLNINGELEEISTTTISNSEVLSDSQPEEFGENNTIYKEFKFAIREENTPGAPVVAGYKRHYAVAIDTNNVEVLKSELSFTLDPQDLIDTLKIIIDRENLIA